MDLKVTTHNSICSPKNMTFTFDGIFESILESCLQSGYKKRIFALILTVFVYGLEFYVLQSAGRIWRGPDFACRLFMALRTAQ